MRDLGDLRQDGVWRADQIKRDDVQPLAGVDDLVSVRCCELKKFVPQTERGTLICNPPYGERMLDIEQANTLYRDMGRVFERRHGWSYSIITPCDTFEQEFGRKADKRRKLYNGMIKCQLFMYFK